MNFQEYVKGNITNFKDIFANNKTSITENLNDDEIEKYFAMEDVCKQVSKLQQIEFNNVFPGPNLNLLYPITAMDRYSIVNWISELNHMSEHSTFLISVAIFDQYIIRNGVMNQGSMFKFAAASTYFAFVKQKVEHSLLENLYKNVKCHIKEKDMKYFQKDIENVLNIDNISKTAGEFLKIFATNREIFNKNEVFEMAKLCLDIALMNINFAGYPYSLLAAVAICIGNRIINQIMDERIIWTNVTVSLSGINWSNISLIYEDLSKYLATVAREVKNGTYNVIITKYNKGNIAGIFLNRAPDI